MLLMGGNDREGTGDDDGAERWGWWSFEEKSVGADVKRMKSKMKRVVRLCYDDGGGYSEAGRRRTKRT